METIQPTGDLVVAVAAPGRVLTPSSSNLHIWVVGLGAIFGLYFALAIPPSQGIDETAHFLRTWLVSSGDLIADERIDPATNVNHAGGVIDRCVIDYIFGYTAAAARPDNYDAGSYWSETTPCDPQVRSWVIADASSNYSPFSYAPQAATVALLRAVGAPLPISFFGGRLAGLLSYLVIVGSAVRLAPRGKWVFAVVALIPMAVMSAATYNSDSMANALAILTVALVTRAVLNPRATTTTIVVLATAMVILPLVKQPYLPLVMLIWLVPGRLLGGGRRAIITKLGICGVTGFFSLVWWKIGFPDTPPSIFKADVDHIAQLKFVIGHPIEFVKVMGRTVAAGAQQSFVLRGMVGSFGMGRFAGRSNDVVAPLLALVLATGVLVAAYQREGGARRTELAPRRSAMYLVVPIATTAAGVVAVFLLMYMIWAPVGALMVNELQGRYFIPLLSVPVLSLTLRRDELRPGRPGWWIIATVVSLLLFAVGKTLLVFY